jgi:hypothetical protein
LDVEWNDLRVRGADIARHWPGTKAPPKSRRGRKMGYDWPEVRDFIFKTMDRDGEFKEWDTGSGWTCQADLERLVLHYMKDEASISSVKSHVKAISGRMAGQPVGQ